MKPYIALFVLFVLIVQPLTAHALLGDVDRDGVPEILLANGRNTDNCPVLFNPDQLDTDHDGLGDACDPAPQQPAPDVADADGDGIPDARDNCPRIPNRDQTNTDGDMVGDVCDDDDDNDGALDAHDNCPLVPNPNQEDLDGDGIGDACDSDDDGDGQPDARDACPLGNGALAAPECRDNNVPRITLRNPVHGSVLRSSTVDFNFVVVDDWDVRLDCEMFSDVNGGGIQTITRFRGLTAFFDFFTGFTSNRFTVQNVPDGTYQWFAACIDDNRNRGVSAVATFTINTQPPQPAGDNTPPTITLIDPVDNAVLNQGNLPLFRFTATDNEPGQLSCQFMSDINGNFRLMGNPVQMNQGANTFVPNNIPPGNYQWNVQCTDAAGNTGAGPFKFHFTINPQQPPVNQCANGVQDVGELGVDCGGVCANVCPVVPPVNQCNNGVQDVGELGVDCGGVCANVCPVVPPIPPIPPVVPVAHTRIPSVSIDADVHTESTPARVIFTATVVGGDGPFRFIWDFDDGTAIETNTNTIEHVFEKSGRRDVTVHVIDHDGDSARASVRIRLHSGTLDGERDVRLGGVVFESASAGFNEAMPGDQLLVSVGLTNTGVEILHNLRLSVVSYDIPLQQRVVLNSIAAGETVTKRLVVDVPPDAQPGDYLIQVALTDENQLTKVSYHPLLIRSTN
ncbi:MAG: thrombospondin type 3 repeat-containing protein [Candidatus Woesearchaeota archaeon]|nr:thrombospondin type 3 repeat-containing protein [Candidatus Woesearchaeota archaeon]